MHRKSRQLTLAAIFASTLTAGGIALLGGTASAATGAPGTAWAPQASEPGGSVRAASYTTISEPLLVSEALPVAGTVPIGLPRITIAEFPAQWSAGQYSGSSLRSEALPGMGASMEQMAEEARQSIRDEASSAKQQIMQEAASAQQRIEQMSQRAQQQVSEQAQSQSQSSASQSQSSSLPESAPGSALGSAPENVPPAISGPESAPPAGLPPTSSEWSSSESSSSGACQ
ncbi:hypothetical protein [Microbispora sp. KK1-11]|uniref:hypothetical protein n=1 Tax=Microbispora sp. KK1-11 TaxID=2053005 RepID=UPI00115BD178|nr:hypothetical protein [Microbispora sp. KK1-11]TQS24768.1 hypothetical protein FLW16_33680 [Microbispora sp. KK1-11]